jgi:predicted nucleic acid-binding protein
MSSGPFLWDTNVAIRHRPPRLRLPGLVSAVVLQELVAGAADGGEVRRWRTVRADAEADGVLVTPNGEDWLEAGRILNALLRGARSRRSARPVAIGKGEQQRLVRDVLIARSARRVNAAVVTYNRGDIEKIRRFCGVRVVEPAEIF